MVPTVAQEELNLTLCFSNVDSCDSTTCSDPEESIVSEYDDETEEDTKLDWFIVGRTTNKQTLNNLPVGTLLLIDAVYDDFKTFTHRLVRADGVVYHAGPWLSDIIDEMWDFQLKDRFYIVIG